MMNELIEKNLEQIKNYCKKYDVEKLHAFGSITTAEFTENSDVDLLIKFKDIPFERYADNYFRLHDLFEKIFNRKVDLVTENS
jgi:predicted nucleotidyltransferase